MSSVDRKRTRIVRPYPTHSLEDALAVAVAIQGSNAGLPFDRALLAKALGTTPASSGYTMRLNSSAKYGLTQGGYNDDLISITPRGEAIVAPKGSDELREALIEAATEPNVFERLYRMLDGKRLPEDAYAQNMLHRELGIHTDLTAECLGIIKANGVYVGVLAPADGSLQVGLKSARELASRGGSQAGDGLPDRSATDVAQATSPDEAPSGGRIFIGNCGNPEPVQLVRDVFDKFQVEYRTTEADDSDGRPVPAGVSEEMRNCTAAVLVFAKDDLAGASSVPNSPERMLFQLGAASALYGDKVVVLKNVGFELANRTFDVNCVEFDPRKPEEAALGLLVELHRAGVIKVVA